MRLNLNSGVVRYRVKKLDECCGVAVVYSVIFYPAPRKTKQLYEEFQKHLLTYMDDYDLARPKLLIADKVGGDLYNFCIHNGWMQGEETPNPKSGNKVTMFEFDRHPDYVTI